MVFFYGEERELLKSAYIDMGIPWSMFESQVGSGHFTIPSMPVLGAEASVAG